MMKLYRRKHIKIRVSKKKLFFSISSRGNDGKSLNVSSRHHNITEGQFTNFQIILLKNFHIFIAFKTPVNGKGNM